MNDISRILKEKRNRNLANTGILEMLVYEKSIMWLIACFSYEIIIIVYIV